MKTPRLSLLAGAIALAALAGCAAKQSSSEPPPAAAPAAPPAVPPPAGSPMAKIQTGMSMEQVTNILGAPTSQSNYASGKAWIPFYYGNDVMRTAYYYKGLGRIVFAAGNQFGAGRGGAVERVEYDPSESGFPR